MLKINPCFKFLYYPVILQSTLCLPFLYLEMIASIIMIELLSSDKISIQSVTKQILLQWY